MTPTAPPELTRFVRDVLGCGCPDDVVARTVLERSPQGELGLDVGGRLLVRVLGSAGLERLIATFPDDVVRLRDERDRRGFNRVRIVVVHPEFEVLGPVLEAMLEAIVEADDRVHVHAIAAGVLPGPLGGSGAATAS